MGLFSTRIEESSFPRLEARFSERALCLSGIETHQEEIKALCAYIFRAAYEGDLYVEERKLPPSLRQNLIFAKKQAEALAPFLCFKQDRIYLEKNAQLEELIEQEMRRLFRKSSAGPCTTHIALNKEQQEALQIILSNHLSFLMGGPGTGKTYMALAVVEHFLSMGKEKILLAAPTARAADLLSHRIKKGSSKVLTGGTIHSLLHLGRSTPRMKKGFFLDADLLIVDESSMIEAPLFAALLSAIPTTCHTLFMGDAKQLSPIGIGSIFADIEKKEESFSPRAYLHTSMRTEIAGITEMAKEVLEGNTPVSSGWPSSEEAVGSILREFSSLSKYVLSDVPEDLRALFSLIGERRILSSLRKGPYGSEAINAFLLREVTKQSRSWWAPIMVNASDDSLDVSNGEMGITIQSANGGSFLYFREGRLRISSEQFHFWEYAFCSSVHKSQGSEYDEVLVLFPKGSERFGKEMIYTAITRAKKSVSILAEKDTLEKMMNS